MQQVILRIYNEIVRGLPWFDEVFEIGAINRGDDLLIQCFDVWIYYRADTGDVRVMIR